MYTGFSRIGPAISGLSGAVNLQLVSAGSWRPVAGACAQGRGWDVAAVVGRCEQGGWAAEVELGAGEAERPETGRRRRSKERARRSRCAGLVKQAGAGSWRGRLSSQAVVGRLGGLLRARTLVEEQSASGVAGGAVAERGWAGVGWGWCWRSGLVGQRRCGGSRRKQGRSRCWLWRTRCTEQEQGSGVDGRRAVRPGQGETRCRAGSSVACGQLSGAEVCAWGLERAAQVEVGRCGGPGVRAHGG
jgi:hypothetical protein